MNKQEFERPYYIDASKLWSLLKTYDYTTFLPYDTCNKEDLNTWHIEQKHETYERQIACSLLEDEQHQTMILTIR